MAHPVSTVLGNGDGHPHDIYDTGEFRIEPVNDLPLSSALESPTSCCRIAGELFFTEWRGYFIRKLGNNGRVSCVAGIGMVQWETDGPADVADIGEVTACAFSVANPNKLVFVDAGSYRVRCVSLSPPLAVSSLAGAGVYQGCTDGPALKSALDSPCYGLACDELGTVFVADSSNCRVRAVVGALAPPSDTKKAQALSPLLPSWCTKQFRPNPGLPLMCTIAGGDFANEPLITQRWEYEVRERPVGSHADGFAFESRFVYPAALAYDSASCVLFVGDRNCIRQVSPFNRALSDIFLSFPTHLSRHLCNLIASYSDESSLFVFDVRLLIAAVQLWWRP